MRTKTATTKQKHNTSYCLLLLTVKYCQIQNAVSPMTCVLLWFALEVTHKLRDEELSNKSAVTDISLGSPDSTGAVNQVGNIYHW